MAQGQSPNQPSESSPTKPIKHKINDLEKKEKINKKKYERENKIKDKIINDKIKEEIQNP